MDCPRCAFVHTDTFEECPKCGVVVAKYLRGADVKPAGLSRLPGASVQADLERAEADREGLRVELRARALAIGLALGFAWLAVRSSPGAVRLIAMWVHETGHAAAAWACGYPAWPGPWFTPVGDERSRLLTLLIAGALGFGAWRAWASARWFWVAAAVVVLGLVTVCTFVLHAGQARQLIVFSGDGGSLLIGTLLMMTVFAREESAVRRDRLRWGLVAIGALAFMDAYATWSEGIAAVPFGAADHGLSDPSVLAEEFGWSVLQLMRRYLQLAHACLAALAVAAMLHIVLPALALVERPTR